MCSILELQDPVVTHELHIHYGSFSFPLIPLIPLDSQVADEQFRAQALAAIAHAANEIEQALGSAQDIEGCIAADGALFVVQTRPQV